MKQDHLTAVLYALLAALFYALNVPCAKLLLAQVPPVCMAGLLYLGAGAGVGILYLFRYPKESPEERLGRADLPYTLGMVGLDTAAPILLMLGVRTGSSANASLLGNFEIVATTLIALLLFREAVSHRLWIAILLITLASILLSFESGGLQFSVGSLFVLGATVCWGLENNCTRAISEKSTYQIVTVKGLCSGAGSMIVSRIVGEPLPAVREILPALLLGFVAYGLSIFTYIRAQKTLGAAKTSAYYAFAPFIGVFLFFLLLHEKLTGSYLAALAVMIAGTLFIVRDTLVMRHAHEHTHTVTHTHDGSTHTHTVTHSHPNDHAVQADGHTHRHSAAELEALLAVQHHH